MQYRSLTAAPVEAREIDGKKVISGYAIVWDSLSQDLGGYREVVRRSAVERSLKAVAEGKKHVSARMQHMGGMTTVGNTQNRTLTLTPDDHGLYYETVPPDNVFGHGAWVAVKDGYVTGSSFAFRVAGGGQNWDYSTSPPTRELLDIELEDVAPVDGPAYLEATAEARSMVLKDMNAMKNEQRTTTGTRVETRQADNGSTFAELYILDEIVPTWMSRYMNDAVSSGKIIEALAAVPSPDRIDVYINSPGGDVYEGTAIYNTLKDHPAPVHVYVRGLAASMASVIAMAGDTVTMGDGAFMMVHNAWTVTAGNATELRRDALLLDKIDDSLAETYAKRSGMDAKAAKALMDEETWLTAQEAVAAGLADRISGKVDPEAMEAVAKRCRELEYRNVPKGMGGDAPTIERRRDLSVDEVLEMAATEKRRAV